MNLLEDRIKELSSFINSFIDIGNSFEDSVESCIRIIHQNLPVDNSGIFSRMTKCNSLSDDLSYVILCIQNKKNEIDKSLKEKKDPKFTLLIRSGRPSTQAVECEIRATNSEIAELENTLLKFENICEYLYHLDKCLDRYIYSLKDLAQYIRK